MDWGDGRKVMDEGLLSVGDLRQPSQIHRKTEIQKLLVSAILDPGNINYSLEFFCPYREASHG